MSTHYNRMNTRSSTATNNGTRRAFRDVSNSSMITDENNKYNAKKSHIAPTKYHTENENQAVVTRSQRHQVENRNPEQNGRSSRYLPQSQDEIMQPREQSISQSSFPSSFSYQHSSPPDNIDERDSDDPLCVTDYVVEMYEYHRSKERTTSVRPLYMENQTHINEKMRSILVDWLVEVHLKFKLVPETLYLTINLIDRYLERKQVSRPKLQLVGVTALLVASKYEEIYPPELRDLVYICDRAYSKQEILDMEENILRALDYQITIPSAHAFLVRYLKAAHADKKMVQLSCYILDGTLQSYKLLKYLPSQLAAASVFIARRAIGRNSWSPTLLKYAEYCEEEVAPVARAVLDEKSSTSNELRAVNKKYISSRYGGVANTRLVCDF
eukprot:CAMPEP_0178958170 /NCGR_PEP_ID=MMETSP0789-20121207/11433_1 /TAXON_ID=3005 /ORGANISM="Rhizosolenia setigera, Strain CCMP 1694" /LENGTH=383 /DNA_ID=CAMNT_0020640725 /DNA_START=86 /DNA_END=1237 /DNA_ORIENTATION=-